MNVELNERGTAKIPGGECTGFALFRGTLTNS